MHFFHGVLYGLGKHLDGHADVAVRLGVIADLFQLRTQDRLVSRPCGADKAV
jgi:hypothetical protein